jgi:hypothetical protein
VTTILDQLGKPQSGSNGLGNATESLEGMKAAGSAANASTTGAGKRRAIGLRVMVAMRCLALILGVAHGV